MAMAAAFDLEIRQYDAVNAFTNAKLSKPIYCYCLEGFNQYGYILELLMALYGLKILPLLWYKELTSLLSLAFINAFTALYCRISKSNAAAIAIRARNIQAARVAA